MTMTLAFVCLLIALCSSNIQSVSQGRIYTDNVVCCHTEIEAADQALYPIHSQCITTGCTFSAMKMTPAQPAMTLNQSCKPPSRAATIMRMFTSLVGFRWGVKPGFPHPRLALYSSDHGDWDRRGQHPPAGQSSSSHLDIGTEEDSIHQLDRAAQVTLTLGQKRTASTSWTQQLKSTRHWSRRGQHPPAGQSSSSQLDIGAEEDSIHQLDRAAQVTVFRRRTGHCQLLSHLHRPRTGHCQLLSHLHRPRTGHCQLLSHLHRLRTGHCQLLSHLHRPRTGHCQLLSQPHRLRTGHCQLLSHLHRPRTGHCQLLSQPHRLRTGHCQLLSQPHRLRTGHCQLLSHLHRPRTGHCQLLSQPHRLRTGLCQLLYHLHRLRTGHCQLLSHLHRLNISHSDEYPSGTGPQTSSRILQSCPTFDTLRLGPAKPCWLSISMLIVSVCSYSLSYSSRYLAL